MTTSSLYPQALRRRLDRLEQENRRMKRAGSALLLLVGGLFLMGQAEPKNKVLEAEQFIVRDSTGKKRALLGMDHPASPGHSPVRVGLYNEESTAIMYLSDGFAGVSITAGGKKRQVVQLFANPNEGSGVKVGTSPMKTAAQVSADANGDVRLVLHDPAGREVFKAP